MSEAATAEEQTTTYPRFVVEKIIAGRMLGALFALLCVLALMGPSKSTVYQLMALGPAALWLASLGMPRLPASLAHESTRPTHLGVLGTYATAACITAVLSFGTWHATPNRDFSGFDRGAGWYTLAFAIVLGLTAASLRQPNLMRPFDSALHVVALACATVFIGAAVSGTFSRGMSMLRMAVLVCGVVVFVVASRTLNRRATDALSRQAVAAAVFSAAGALMAAASFMSWGAGGFIVNYRPGTSMGGFDGRVSMWAGVAIAGIWIAIFLSGTVDEGRWRHAVRGTAALGFVGLGAVVNSASGSSHPGRTLAAAGCVVVMLKAATVRPLHDGAEAVDGLPTSASALIGRCFTGIVSFLGALLFIVGTAQGGVIGFARMGRSMNYDDLMALFTFGGLGLVILRGALSTAAGRALPANVAGIVLAGMAFIMVFPPDNVSGALLLSAAVFAVPAAAGLAAELWIGPPAQLGLGSQVLAAVRTRWIHLLGLAVLSYIAIRWVMPNIVPAVQYPENPTDAERSAVREQAQWRSALRSVIPLAALALVTAGRRHLLRAGVFTAVSAVLYFLAQTVLDDQTELLRSEYGLAIYSGLSGLAVMVFSLGRGRSSAAALATVTAFSSPWVIQAILFALPQSVYSLPGVSNTLFLLPHALHHAAIAAVFFAFPFGPAKQQPGVPATPDATSGEDGHHEPDDVEMGALLGSADGTER